MNLVDVRWQEVAAELNVVAILLYEVQDKNGDSSSALHAVLAADKQKVYPYELPLKRMKKYKKD